MNCKISLVKLILYNVIAIKFSYCYICLLVWRLAHRYICNLVHKSLNWSLKEILNWGRHIPPTNPKHNYLTKSILTIDIVEVVVLRTFQIQLWVLPSRHILYRSVAVASCASACKKCFNLKLDYYQRWILHTNWTKMALVRIWHFFLENPLQRGHHKLHTPLSISNLDP